MLEPRSQLSCPHVYSLQCTLPAIVRKEKEEKLKVLEERKQRKKKQKKRNS